MNAHPTKNAPILCRVAIYGDQLRMNAHPTKNAPIFCRVAIYGDQVRMNAPLSMTAHA
ncbi:hypothetical protein SAMN05518863_10730 [Candidatus Pantoea symbiotica]|uniref:Uncharacterized protein n=1 Tax=Candidatus Pantoea symbiotica TaxID=1884370 RepID=A0A1I3ZHK1_9GAMM|nr:hypothetical protein SAMN05518863_10730 [Pantoea symbiotica]SFU93659.1 hypothetical protein SAMN05518864_107295 [Pantoea sp. YR525]